METDTNSSERSSRDFPRHGTADTVGHDEVNLKDQSSKPNSQCQRLTKEMHEMVLSSMSRRQLSQFDVGGGPE